MKVTQQQNREREIEFWDNDSKRARVWIEHASPADIIDKIHSGEMGHWWEDLLGKIQNKKILDIGCGNSYFVTYWQLTGNEATGSDFSPGTIVNNKLLNQKLGLKESFYVASSEKIEAENDSFDIVHMRWVIHHIPSELQDSSMQEIKRVLKPGGKVIALETTYYYPFRWIVQTQTFGKFNILRNYALKKGFLDPEERALPNKDYIELFKRNGFKIDTIAYDFTFFWYPVKLLTKNKSILRLATKIDRSIKKIIPTIFSKDIKIVAKK